MAVVSLVCGRLQTLDAELCSRMASDLQDLVNKHLFVGVSWGRGAPFLEAGSLGKGTCG